MKHIIFVIFAFSFISCQAIVNTPPLTYELKQNFPNPFTDTTVVLYGVPSVAPQTKGPYVRVVVNDRFNHTQAILVNTDNHSAGTDFRVVWNGRGADYQKVPAGIYYIELHQISHGDVYVQGRVVAIKQ